MAQIDMEFVDADPEGDYEYDQFGQQPQQQYGGGHGQGMPGGGFNFHSAVQQPVQPPPSFAQSQPTYAPQSTLTSPFGDADPFQGDQPYTAPSRPNGEEEPLLEELGINFKHIYAKSRAVLNVLSTVDSHIMDDTDLAGPLVFCLLFGATLLVSGKSEFGFVYGVAVIGTLSLYSVLGLMGEKPLTISRTASVLGYCLLPMVALSSIAILLKLSGIIGTILSALSIAWCTFSAARIFTTVLDMHHQSLLVAYPCGLLYGVFALLTIF
eukprot:m.6190 g.6190  ORF g.6190 m.6190 type:complete len:267 (-) comp5137_c0_seq1:94-894(-)